MAIPEQQLSSWSTLGAQQGSAETYNSIRFALGQQRWPQGMDHHVYLQGSYPNHTNIRGDSDVDVVVESQNVFYHNVPDHLRGQYGLTTPGAYTWRQFREEVKRALVGHYGPSSVTDGDKCIKVAGRGSRLNADVVPCNTYREYSDNIRYTSGIAFWTRSGVQIINFPKAHLNNGSQKNNRCSMHYKPSIRVFKNARNRAGNEFPSYFLECLAYNVPDRCFASGFSSTFIDTINYLASAVRNGTIQTFKCQNECRRLIGRERDQTDLTSVERFVNGMVTLWNNWA